jgi:hypothetical protein
MDKKPLELRKDKDWCNLYEHVKKEIMGYNENFKLPKAMILRLKGLSEGKFMANKKQKPMASYDFKTILITFQICKVKILDWFKTNNTKFKDEMHKFNSAMIFVENEINDVVIRLNNTIKNNEKVETMKLDNINNEGAEYKSKQNNNKTNKILDELW